MAKKAAKEKKKLIINHKEYTMPKADVDAYMHYLEVREGIMDTENKSGLYTRKQFSDMMECICEIVIRQIIWSRFRQFIWMCSQVQIAYWSG